MPFSCLTNVSKAVINYRNSPNMIWSLIFSLEKLIEISDSFIGRAYIALKILVAFAISRILKLGKVKFLRVFRSMLEATPL